MQALDVCAVATAHALLFKCAIAQHPHTELARGELRCNDGAIHPTKCDGCLREVALLQNNRSSASLSRQLAPQSRALAEGACFQAPCWVLQERYAAHVMQVYSSASAHLMSF